jgi:hypothetical protein
LRRFSVHAHLSAGSRTVALASGFLLLAGFGCGASSSLPTGAMDADAGGGAVPEVVYLLPSSAAGVTTGPLLAGVTYTVIVEGTISVWRSSDWSSVCAGTPSPAPMFPSPGGTGPTGVDPEWVWAWPEASPSLCPGGVPVATPPRAARSVQFEVSQGSPPVDLPPSFETEMTPDHAYTYSITGGGTAAAFIVPTTHPSDRPYYYGEYRITIAPP